MWVVGLQWVALVVNHEDGAWSLGKVHAVFGKAYATAWQSIFLAFRQEARDEYVAQYNEDDLYSDLDPSIFRHRYVMHLTDLNRMGQVVQSLESVEGIAKVRADQDISNGFITVRNIAGVISIALIAILLIISVFIISNTINFTTSASSGRRSAI